MTPLRLALLATAIPLAAPLLAATLVGADTIGPVVQPALADHPGLATSFRGTADAINDLRSGKAEVALMFIDEASPIPEVAKGEWRKFPVAHQAVFVAVNNANRATEINLPTLAGLYGQINDTRFDSWTCLPGSGLLQSPMPIAPSAGQTVTISYFRREVMTSGPFRKTVRFARDDDDAESRATTTVNGITLLSRPPRAANLKLLAVADGRKDKPTRAYAPTDSDINSGDYPLRVSLCVVFPKNKAAVAAPIVRKLAGNECVNLLKAKGLTPVPENIRKKFTQTLDS